MKGTDMVILPFYNVLKPLTPIQPEESGHNSCKFKVVLKWRLCIMKI